MEPLVSMRMPHLRISTWHSLIQGDLSCLKVPLGKHLLVDISPIERCHLAAFNWFIFDYSAIWTMIWTVRSQTIWTVKSRMIWAVRLTRSGPFDFDRSGPSDLGWFGPSDLARSGPSDLRWFRPSDLRGSEMHTCWLIMWAKLWL